jgi:transcriptional regulator with XRE-family HTH domain
MDAAPLLRRARTEAGMSLRALASRAATSHSTLAAYEAGRVDPTVATLDRVVAAAGFSVVTELARAVDGDAARGAELVEVLRLAAQFPTRHEPTLAAPVFPHDR